MGTNEKIEERKRWNAPFLACFAYWMKVENITQGELAKKMGTASSHISDFRNGKKKVSEKTMNELVIHSKGKLNINYMLGLSKYMLVANVPDEEIIEIMHRKDNPDYEVMCNERSIDNSSLVNATIAARDEHISTLQDQIATLKKQIEEKDDIIAMLKVKVANLENAVAKFQLSENTYPFPLGAAEPKGQKASTK